MEIFDKALDVVLSTCWWFKGWAVKFIFEDDVM